LPCHFWAGIFSVLLCFCQLIFRTYSHWVTCQFWLREEGRKRKMLAMSQQLLEDMHRRSMNSHEWWWGGEKLLTSISLSNGALAGALCPIGCRVPQAPSWCYGYCQQIRS
jgi:hypothetical protein